MTIPDEMIEAAARAIDELTQPGTIMTCKDLARAALEAAEAMRWRPIESAPRDGTDILVAGRRFGVTGNGPFDDGPYIEVSEWWQNQWTITLMNGYREPTHWQPLPEPPGERS